MVGCMLGCCAGACGSGLLVALASVVLSQRDKIVGFVGRNYIKMLVFFIAPVVLSFYAVKMGHVEVPAVDVPYVQEAREFVDQIPGMKEARLLFGLKTAKEKWSPEYAKLHEATVNLVNKMAIAVDSQADNAPVSARSWSAANTKLHGATVDFASTIATAHCCGCVAGAVNKLGSSYAEALSTANNQFDADMAIAHHKVALIALVDSVSERKQSFPPHKAKILSNLGRAHDELLKVTDGLDDAFYPDKIISEIERVIGGQAASLVAPTDVSQPPAA